MINKIKKSLNKITVGKIFIAGLLMLPMTLIFPENNMWIHVGIRCSNYIRNNNF